VERLRALIEPLAAYYFLKAKNPRGKPVDPVARFHLGNGARLEQINWLGDTSTKGLRESAGVMVNYLYQLDDIEKNTRLTPTTTRWSPRRGEEAAQGRRPPPVGLAAVVERDQKVALWDKGATR